MAHNGKALKIYLRINQIPVDGLAEKLRVSRQTIYNWFEKMEFDGVIVGKLKKAGIPGEALVMDFKDENQNPNKMDDLLKQKDDIIRQKDEVIQQQKEIIEMLRGRTDTKSKAAS